jgi:GNAT superfamily N-acetyltransferase
MEPVEIRLAQTRDASAISRLADQLGYPTSPGQAEKRLTAVLGSANHAVLVAFVDGQVVGWLHIFIAQRMQSDSFAEIGGFVIAESHRRHGIGRRLLATAEQWAAGRGAAMLRVRSRSDRHDAHAFYKRLGFTINKQQQVFDKSLEHGE